MGIDFNGLVNFGKQLAKTDGGNNPNVIENESIKIFQSEVAKTAQSQGIDTNTLYSDANVNALLGVEINKPAFDDNALDDMFALAGISPKKDADTESRASASVEQVGALYAKGIDLEEIEDVTSAEVANYVVNSPKGSITRINNLAETFSELPEDLLETAGQLAYYYADVA